MPDEGLVLATRLAVTRRNLQRINELAQTIDRRKAGVEELLSLPQTLSADTEALLTHMSTLRNRAFESRDQELLRAIKQVEEPLEALWTNLVQRIDDAATLRAELFEPLGDRKDVQDFLARAVEQRLTAQNYWSQRDSCEALFSEYVDLLHGIALRSARFGDQDLSIGQLFAIADALPSVWGRIEGWSWESLAVPSWLEGRRATEAMVLRVGFPEWTVWALPLLHHEFAHVFVKKKRLSTVDTDQVALTDALAVLVGGPAYACATLLLRLDPTAVDPARPEIGLRAATILGSLRAVAEEADEGLQPVARLAERLEAEWLRAVDDAGGSREAQAAALASRAWEVPLESARAALLGSAANDGRPPRPPWADRWSTVSTWAQNLADGSTKAIDMTAADAANRERRLSLTLMLNAAWLARVRPDPAHDAAAEDVEEIGKRAVERMLQHIRPRKEREDSRDSPNVNRLP